GYDQTKGENFQKQITERLRTLPGVQSVSIATPLPLDAYSNGTNIFIEGREYKPNENGASVMFSVVAPDYFKTMVTPIVQGHEFTELDRETSTQVVIINETMAKRYWPAQDPIGKRIRIGGEKNPWLQIVGVAKDGKYVTLGEPPMDYLFLPLLQNYEGKIT